MQEQIRDSLEDRDREIAKEPRDDDSYVLADIVLLVYKLFHFKTELLVGPLELFPLVLGLLHTETQKKKKINHHNHRCTTNSQNSCTVCSQLVYLQGSGKSQISGLLLSAVCFRSVPFLCQPSAHRLLLC